MRVIYCSLLLALPLLFSGCARNISSNVYDSGTIGAAVETYQGMVISCRKITVKEAERLQDNTAGAVIGGIGGAALGNTIGKGTGNTLATALGGIGGAVGGAYAQDYLGTQEGSELVVRTNEGRILTVKQKEPLPVGSRVLVMVDHEGRSRAIPDTSGVNFGPSPASATTTIVKPKRRY